MTRRPHRPGADTPRAPQPSSPQDAPRRVAGRQAAGVATALGHCRVRAGARILDVCCGLGRQAEALAAAGYRVVGMDIRHDDQVRSCWQQATLRQPRLHFLSGDARDLPLDGPFGAALLLYNSLAQFHTNDDAIALLSRIRRVIAPRGVLLIDNTCRTIWSEIAAGRYADGISDDGLWQMLWLPGRGVFALRYGEKVAPDRLRPDRHETLYRAWSFDELDLLCRLTGWTLDPACSAKALLQVRPARNS